MTVRTKQLALGHVASGATVQTIYTCPSGRTAIVKTASMTNGGSVAVSCSLFIASADTTEVGHIIFESFLGGTVAEVNETFFVLEPDQLLRVYASSIATGPVLFIVCGAELDGVA